MALFFSMILSLTMNIGLPGWGLGIGAHRAYATNLKDQIKAKSACVMDLNSGQVIFSKDGDSKLKVGELANMVLALEAADKLDMVKSLRVSGEASRVGNKGIDLQEGEIISIGDLLNASLNRSARDAAAALAIEIAGSQAKFDSDIMGKSLKKAGCKNTAFSMTNPGGNLSTAEDICRIAKQVVDNEEVFKRAKEKSITIDATNMSEKRFYPSLAVIPEEYGDITGLQMVSLNQDGSHSCLVGYGESQDTQVVFAALGEDNKKACYQDARRLVKKGLSTFKTVVVASPEDILDRVPVKGGSQTKVPVVVKEDFKVMIDKAVDPSMIEKEVVIEKELKAPLKKGLEVGYVRALDAGKEVARQAVYTRADVAPGGIAAKFGLSVWSFWTIVVFLVILILLLIWLLIKIAQSKHRKKKIRQAEEARQRKIEKQKKIDREQKARRRKARGWKY